MAGSNQGICLHPTHFQSVPLTLSRKKMKNYFPLSPAWEEWEGSIPRWIILNEVPHGG
jgi:hypothetical protein